MPIPFIVAGIAALAGAAGAASAVKGVSKMRDANNCLLYTSPSPRDS